jgi:uncharacterized membrane protein
MTLAERYARAKSRHGLGFARSAGRNRRPVAAATYRHPVNQALFGAAPFGARLADRVTGFMGSWRFIAIQTAIVAMWLAANIVLLTRPFDPFPFILLNLAFTTQAAYAAPLILLAGNRASQRDRLTLEHACEEGELGDVQNQRLLTSSAEILTRVAALEARILDMERAILGALETPRTQGAQATAKAPAKRADSHKRAA